MLLIKEKLDGVSTYHGDKAVKFVKLYGKAH